MTDFTVKILQVIYFVIRYEAKFSPSATLDFQVHLSHPQVLY